MGRFVVRVTNLYLLTMLQDKQWVIHQCRYSLLAQGSPSNVELVKCQQLH